LSPGFESLLAIAGRHSITGINGKMEINEEKRKDQRESNSGG
jgi:hypothetical protein